MSYPCRALAWLICAPLRLALKWRLEELFAAQNAQKRQALAGMESPQQNCCQSALQLVASFGRSSLGFSSACIAYRAVTFAHEAFEYPKVLTTVINFLTKAPVRQGSRFSDS